MAKQFAIIGMGRFGSAMAVELSKMGHEVLAIDSSEERLEDVSQYVTHAVQLDAAEENALQSIGLRNFDAVIVAIGTDIRSSVMICMLAKEAGAPVVVAKSSDDAHSKILLKLGVDKVIFPEHDMAVRMAHSLAVSSVMDFIRLSDDFSMSEIQAPESFTGQTLAELKVRSKYGLNVAAVKCANGIFTAPSAEYRFCSGDILVVIAKNTDLNKFEAKMLQ